MIFLILLFIALLIILIAAQWKIYTKAQKPGWAVLVPVYNILVWLQIINKPWWWILLLLFVPIADIVILILMYHKLAKVFGKGTGFTLGLLFLGFIFFPNLRVW